MDLGMDLILVRTGAWKSWQAGVLGVCIIGLQYPVVSTLIAESTAIVATRLGVLVPFPLPCIRYLTL